MRIGLRHPRCVAAESTVEFNSRLKHPAGMDKQAEALEQWLDRIQSSDDGVRNNAASDLAMVLEKYVGPVPGMPPG
jgi:hypothetical protein